MNANHSAAVPLRWKDGLAPLRQKLSKAALCRRREAPILPCGVAILLSAYRLVAVGTRDDIHSQIPRTAGAAQVLLRAVVAQYDGNVDGAVRLLRAQLRLAQGFERAAIADVLAPILVSRSEMAEVAKLADILETAGWNASAFAFRAVVAAGDGDRQSAKLNADAARKELEQECDDVIHFRVLQRLALAAFYLNQHGDAIELALAAVALCVPLGAWRGAAGCYSIAYNVHHDVTGDLEEANRFARLWRMAAINARDKSFEQLAMVAEYELAVQFFYPDRTEALEEEIRKHLQPQQYAERFAYALSYALVRGAKDLVAMRTLLQVLQSTGDRSRGEWALCSALIALACAALLDDESARKHMRDALARLGRTVRHDRAYERHYRRLARISIAAVCVLIGDHVRADRTVAAQESQMQDDSARIPDFIRQCRWADFPRSLTGMARVFEAAVEARRRNEMPAGLTPAEFEILRLLGNGWSAGRIARATDRSVNTVYNHTRAILGKLEATRAPEAVAIARERGFLR